METITVEIFVPAINSTFDFRLPATGRVYDVTQEIVRILETTQQNLDIDDDFPMLCDIESGAILDPAKRIAQTKLHDSSKLILI
ncbi:MAG: hypothetical protein IJ124_10420 [Clostridia bacterium]|nr:hypothetical protein [Clostridia bacterium]